MSGRPDSRSASALGVHPKNLVAFDFWQFRKVVMPARLRLSWGMKTLKLFLLSVLGSLEFGWQAIRYALIFVSAFFRQRASLGCEMVAMRSQLTFYKESIRQKRQPRPRFNPAFRLLWVLLSSTAHPLPLGWLYEPETLLEISIMPMGGSQS